jgi:tetratricopeptide (TPR) repeat protein
MTQTIKKRHPHSNQKNRTRHITKGINMKICMSILLLIFFSGTAFAQQEIPDKIKDKLANGIKDLENSKTPEDMDKAAREFSEAAVIAPEYPDAHYYLGKTLSMMQGNAGKAVKELKKYLELSPDAAEKEQITQEIGQLEDSVKFKNKSYLMGISLIEFSNGIYVRQVNPNYSLDGSAGRLNSRVNRGGGPTGIKAGDKIIKINNTDVKGGSSIQDVIKLIEEDTSTGKFFTMVKDGKDVTGNYVQITVERGGQNIVQLMGKGVKKNDPLIRDLGEEDLSTIIAETKTPLVVSFVSDWCDDCEKCLYAMQGLGYTYKDAITMITVNIDENIYTAKEFNVSKGPAIQIYVDGAMVDKIDGYDKELLDNKIKALMK